MVRSRCCDAIAEPAIIANVKVIVNARNFGHIRSPMHAFLQTRGDCAIGIVADFQDPPELIPELIAKWEEGYSMVLCVKRTSEENPLMFWIRKKFYVPGAGDCLPSETS